MRYIAFFCLFFFQLASAQDKTFYLDDNLMPASKEAATFYRVVKDYEKEQPTYTFQLFYKTGKLKQEAISTNRDVEKFEGQLLAYYDNTQIEKTEMYRNGKKDGVCKTWYPNGSKHLEGFYTYDGKQELLHVTKFWDPKKIMTVSEGNGVCEFVTENLTEKGPVVNGLRDGNWTGNHVGPDYSFTEDYEKGVLKGGVSTDTDNKKYLYVELEVKPEPQDGLNKFYEYIGKNFKPAKKPEKDGKIILAFIVNKQGTLEDISIYKGLDADLDAEAIRVLSKCDKWKPALQRGVPVRAKYMLPISIQKP
ncbi:energy transducer TonB [Flavobacterium silvaticum]|uniref:TonB C-terminal domain-containing protein n=1 Tax=Flavobacterium silvaticum TaxID=1852020 RepID=A0A972FJP4_9FLAO|nr:energy transducer TonB [Flavobacterium silvaticum]NMH27211.1 hypothetical protein [Flavobacterium silvaticum]